MVAPPRNLHLSSNPHKLTMARAGSFVLKALCLLIFPVGTNTQIFNSQISLSHKILASDAPTSTVGNVNIIESKDDVDGSILEICYLPYLMGFTYGDGIPDNALGEYDGVAATLLAMEHLNTGNGSIIPELSNINQRCPLRFTTKAFDTEYSASVGGDHVITITDRSRTDQLFPCAILGAGSSSVSIPTSIISGLRDVPQVSPISTSSALDDVNQFKLFGRTIPSDDGTAIPLLAKLSSWGVDHLAVIHLDNSYGNAYADGIRLHAQKEYPHLKVVTVDFLRGGKISETIKFLRDTQFKYFFGILDSEDLDRVMVEAHNQGIAGTGHHVWLFSDAVGSHALGRDFAIGSALEKAYKGSGVLSAVGSVPGRDTYTKFEQSMQQIAKNEEDMAFLFDHLPTSYQDGNAVNHSLITDGESFLNKPGILSPFIFDAVIALGLASCQLVENSEGGDNFTGEQLFHAFVNTSFDGTTGPIVLNQETGTRDPNSASFSIMNVVHGQDVSTSQDTVRFEGVKTDIFELGQWTSFTSYIFNDGTNIAPPDLPVVNIETNYFSSGMRAVGLVLCGIVVVMALTSMLWTYYNRRKQVVRASQPIFLHFISAGVLLMGLSIIPLSVDLGVADQKGADVACMSVAWLVVVGFSLTFSALFTKTHRINQIMKSAAKCQRVKLSAADVVKPMANLLLLNLVVLSIWTAVDPLKHITFVVSKDIFLRNSETYGTCYSQNATIFLAILCVINLGSLLFALFQAYQARKLSSDFQESNYIFAIMALISLVSFIGIPVIVIAQDLVEASYYVKASIVFVMCTSIILLIFTPKVLALRQQNNLRRRSTRANGSNSITGTNRWSLYSNTSDLSADVGMEIKNFKTAHAELERENRELKQENDRLLAKEKKQAEKLEKLANQIHTSWRSQNVEWEVDSCP